MRIIITCGPGYEPIDQVRRLTNFSTGELGLLIAEEMQKAGHDVCCFKGEMATAHREIKGLQTFSTNEDLLQKLESKADWPDAVFHCAALCDYRVKAAYGADEAALSHSKIPTSIGEITLRLEPTIKVLPRLRPLFPQAKIVGWKYELDGSREDALSKAAHQIQEAKTNACVVNGAAWGGGFGFLQDTLVELSDKAALAAFLKDWLAISGNH
jgi:phosphopantothenate---cysteine ligase (CTP)